MILDDFGDGGKNHDEKLKNHDFFLRPQNHGRGEENGTKRKEL